MGHGPGISGNRRKEALVLSWLSAQQRLTGAQKRTSGRGEDACDGGGTSGAAGSAETKKNGGPCAGLARARGVERVERKERELGR